MPHQKQNRQSTAPKYNFIEVIGIVLTFIGAVFGISSIISMSPLPLGAASLGIGLLAAVAVNSEITQDLSKSESMLANIAIVTIMLGLLGVIQGIGIHTGFIEAPDVETTENLFISGGLFVGGLIISGLGSYAKP